MGITKPRAWGNGYIWETELGPALFGTSNTFLVMFMEFDAQHRINNLFFIGNKTKHSFISDELSYWYHAKFHYQTNNPQENNLLLCVGSSNEFNLLENPSFAVQRNEVLISCEKKGIERIVMLLQPRLHRIMKDNNDD